MYIYIFIYIHIYIYIYIYIYGVRYWLVTSPIFYPPKSLTSSSTTSLLSSSSTSPSISNLGFLGVVSYTDSSAEGKDSATICFFTAIVGGVWSRDSFFGTVYWGGNSFKSSQTAPYVWGPLPELFTHLNPLILRMLRRGFLLLTFPIFRRKKGLWLCSCFCRDLAFIKMFMPDQINFT